MSHPDLISFPRPRRATPLVATGGRALRAEPPATSRRDVPTQAEPLSSSPDVRARPPARPPAGEPAQKPIVGRGGRSREVPATSASWRTEPYDRCVVGLASSAWVDGHHSAARRGHSRMIEVFPSNIPGPQHAAAGAGAGSTRRRHFPRAGLDIPGRLPRAKTRPFQRGGWNSKGMPEEYSA